MLLARVSQSFAGVTKAQLRETLAMLVNDGLLIKTEQCYAFRSGLVRRY